MTHTDSEYGCGQYDHFHNRQTGFHQSTTVNPNIIRVNIEEKLPAIAALVRNFRENAVYTEDSYKHLVKRLCAACGIPDYKPNLPIYIHDPQCTSPYAHTTSTHSKCKAKYVKGEKGKELHIRNLEDVKAFAGCFFLYLKKRNSGFNYENDETVILKGQTEEARFAKEIMKRSKPQVIRRFEVRSFIKEMSL